MWRKLPACEYQPRKLKAYATYFSLAYKKPPQSGLSFQEHCRRERLMVRRQITQTAAKFAAAGWMTLAGCAAMLAVPGCQSGRDWMADKPQTRVHASARQAGTMIDVNDQQTSEVRMSLARMMESQGKLDRAEQIYKSAMKANPKDPVPYWRMAIIHSRRGHLEKSIDNFNKALERSPGNPQIFSDVGYTHYLRGNYQQAEANYRQALAIKPNDARTKNNLGMLLARSGRVDDAITTFSEAGLDGPDVAENIGLALTLEGELDGAKSAYERAIALSPNSDSANQGLERVIAMMNVRDDGNPVVRSPAHPAKTRMKSENFEQQQLANLRIQNLTRFSDRRNLEQFGDGSPGAAAAAQTPNVLPAPPTAVAANTPLLSPPSFNSAIPISPRPAPPAPLIQPSMPIAAHLPSTNSFAPLSITTPNTLDMVPNITSREIPPLPPIATTRSPRPLLGPTTYRENVLQSSAAAAPGELPVIQPADFPKRRVETPPTNTGLTNVDPWQTDQPVTLMRDRSQQPADHPTPNDLVNP